MHYSPNDPQNGALDLLAIIFVFAWGITALILRTFLVGA